ncbi:hypothetical protein [Chryseobacterium pennae]|nr:hypothetical protein [Chryseobacterium pennae]
MKKGVTMRTADMFVRDPLYEEKTPVSFQQIYLQKHGVIERLNELLFTEVMIHVGSVVYNLKTVCT